MDGLQESDITFTSGQYACLSITYIGKLGQFNNSDSEVINTITIEIKGIGVTVDLTRCYNYFTGFIQ